jgi:uncharacterized damage-inducible protein DinB
MPEKEASLSPAEAVLRSFAIHNRIHLYLLDALAPEVWEAATPDGKGRNIAALVSHMHGVRLMWLKAAGDTALPPASEKTASIPEAKKSLEASAASIHALLAKALQGDGRIPGFKPDAWAFASYLIAHEAHHRGQMTLLARQLGHPLEKSVNFGLWQWGVR